MKHRKPSLFRSAGRVLAMIVGLAATPVAFTAGHEKPNGATEFSRESSAQPPIRLPPIRVEETFLSRPWRYAEAPGCEILSHCPDDVTAELIRENQDLLALLEVILPKRLQPRSDVPTGFVFFGDRDKSAFPPGILNSLQHPPAKSAAARAGPDQDPAAGPATDWLPNFRLWDHDAVSIFFIEEEADVRGGQSMISPGYLRYLLEARTPTLPPWFVAGMMEFYRTVSMNLPESRPPSIGPALGMAESPSADHPGPNTLTVGPVFWLSDKLTRTLWAHPGGKPRLLPMATLFSESTPPPAGDESGKLRRAQAALFIRWALEGGRQSRQEALWKFVDQASHRPATEGMFQDCFALSFAAAEKNLGDYLPHAVTTRLTLRPASMPEAAPVSLRDATKAEVSRIKGGLNRQEIFYVREVLPSLAGPYIEQARRTLRRSYEAGDRDLRLVAELGLCECEAGNDAGARPFLEVAVQGGVARPRAYYELARIRLAGIRATTPAAPLTAPQLADVLQPLYLMRRHAPALREAYELMAKVWLQSEAVPGREQLAVLTEGVGLFPRDSRLIFSFALLCATHAQSAEAQALIAQGLEVTSDPAERTRLQRLQAAITSHP